MKRLLLRGLLLAAPFLVIAASIRVIDPFDYFGPSRVLGDRVKELTAGKLYYALWKVHQFKQNPSSRILLGDSRMDLLNLETIRSATGQRYFDFAYGGGTPIEAVDTYWLASRMVHLDEVYLEMGIINFNSYQNLNRVPEVVSMDSKPLLYLSNRVVLRAAWLSVYVALTGDTIKLEAPSLDREGFWRFQIDEAVPQVMHQYDFPVSLAKELEAMAADCRRNGTKLVILIPPSHVDIQAKISALGRDADVARFKAFAATLGTVYDFEFPNALTSDSSRFRDPFHLKDSDEIVREVWGPEHPFARRVPPLVPTTFPETAPAVPRPSSRSQPPR